MNTPSGTQHAADGIEALIVEPDDQKAAAIASAIERGFGGSRCMRLECHLGLPDTSLRDFSFVICADRPPECDALLAIDAIHDRRDTLPIIVAFDDRNPARMAEAMKRGAADCALQPHTSPDALAFLIDKCLRAARLERDQFRLHAGLTRSLAELVRRNRELSELAGRLEMMASTDPLTSLANRWWLKQRLEPMFAEAVRYGSDLACMMLDLDGFKHVNDRHGHQRGDRVLALTGKMIRTEIRAADVAARYGGDEFIILMPRSSCTTAVNLAQRLQKIFETRIRPEAEIGDECSVCCGVACVSISRPGAAEVLVRHADTALYAAKHAGAGRTMVCGADGVTPVDARSFAA